MSGIRNHTKQISTDTERTHRMCGLLERLFRDAPKMEDATGPQAPAIQCQVVLRCGEKMNGALSTTPEGPLRFMTVAQTDNRGTMSVIEIFFDVEELAAIYVVRASEKTSPLITG